MRSRMIRGGIAAMGILMLVLDSQTALLGAKDGIDLCIRSVVPSIFPFLVLSGLLTSALVGCDATMLRPLGRLIGIPKGTEALFLTGTVGGYPIGAQTIHQAWEKGLLSKKDAHRMLGFCCNAGPSFLFGILGIQFTHRAYLWMLWAIHIFSALIVGISLPSTRSIEVKFEKSSVCTFPEALKKAVHTMAIICGWVIFFRVLLAFLDRWILWIVPIAVKVTIHGFLELANGCCNLNLITSEGLRFVVASGMLGFGGICVYLQTLSVTGSLGAGQYLRGKCLQTVISIFFSILLQFWLFPASEKIQLNHSMLATFAILCILIVAIGLSWKKRGSIPAFNGV